MKTTATESVKFGKGIRYSKDYPFFYDRNVINELTSVSLHANTSTLDNGINWVKAIGAVEDSGEEYPYALDPLIRAVLSEDYQVATSNSFSEFGSNLLGNMFNQFKPYAPYAAHLAKLLKEANEKEEEMKVGTEQERKDINSDVGRFLDSFTDKLYGILEDSPDLLNRHLIAQGARFSYYSGTGVGFGNLTMKFTVFADWINGEFKSCDDQLKKLYPYCFGKYVQALDSQGNITGTNTDLGNFVTNNKDLVNRYFGWQLPPGGFIAKVQDVDKIQFGTLKLKFGAFYSLPNLVVENAQFMFSKQMVKVLKPGETENDLTPLFCDVILTFKPATKFTDNSLRNFVSGKSMEKERGVIEDAMSEKLTDEMINNALLMKGG